MPAAGQAAGTAPGMWRSREVTPGAATRRRPPAIQFPEESPEPRFDGTRGVLGGSRGAEGGGAPACGRSERRRAAGGEAERERRPRSRWRPEAAAGASAVRFAWRYFKTLIEIRSPMSASSFSLSSSQCVAFLRAELWERCGLRLSVRTGM